MSLKQSAKDSSAELEHFNGDSSDCWHRERDHPCLRVEVRADEVFIFPYQQFLCAQHVHTAGGETLKITLSTHEVTVEGLRMEKLVAALQEFSVEWIKPLPTLYRGLVKTSESVITCINVRGLGE